MSSKKKSNKTTVTSTVDTEVIKQTTDEVAVAQNEVTESETTVEETKVEEPVVEETPVVEEKPVEDEVVVEETPIDITPSIDETVKEEIETTVEETKVEEPVVEETPVVEEKPVEETKVETNVEVKSGKVEMSGSASDVQVEMSKKYKVKFAQSYFMKTCAANRELSLFSMLETWMINRSAYIGLLNMTDYDYIKKFMEANTITYKYKVVSAETKQQFLSKLNFNTQYAVSHK